VYNRGMYTIALSTPAYSCYNRLPASPNPNYTETNLRFIIGRSACNDQHGRICYGSMLDLQGKAVEIHWFGNIIVISWILAPLFTTLDSDRL
jgi:hypothetical protein